MKKVLLSLLAVAALVLSCQNYDDEFAALNTKISSLESQINSLAELRTAVTGVQSSVAALQSAVAASNTALTASIGAISADLVNLQSAIDAAATDADLTALKTELTTTLAALQSLIETNSASIASLIISNTELKDALEELGVDVDSVLAANATFEGALTITNDAELAYAKSLGIKVATIKGDVYVKVDAFKHTSGGDGTGLTAAEVNSVVSQITYVVGNVKIETDESLDLSKLANVTGDYVVIGHDVSDNALLSVGDDVLFNYDGAYTSNLQTADNIYLVMKPSKKAATDGSTVAEVGTTSVDFTALTKATGVQSVSATVAGQHTSGASISFVNAGSSPDSKSITVEGTSAGLATDTNTTTSIKIGQAPVVAVVGKNKLTAVELHYAADKGAAADGLNATGVDPLASLTVTGTALTSIKVMAAQITGSVDINTKELVTSTAKATVDMPNLLTAGGNAHTFTSDALDHNMVKLIKVGSLELDEDLTVSLPALTHVYGNISLPKTTSLALANLTRVGAALTTGQTEGLVAGGNITADLISGTISFPKLTKAGDVSMNAITSFSAPLAKLSKINIEEATVSGSITSSTVTTVTLATSIEVGAVSTFASSPSSAASFPDAAAITSLTLKAQDADITPGSFTMIRTLNITGAAKTDGTPWITSMSITDANKSLTTLTLGGTLGSVSVATAANAGAAVGIATYGNTSTALTTINTSGTIVSLTVNYNYDLVTLNALHTDSTTATVANASTLSVADNYNLTTIKTGITTFKDITIINNSKLTSLDLSSVVKLPVGWSAAASHTANIDILGNYLDKTSATYGTRYGIATLPVTSTTNKLNDFIGMTGSVTAASAVSAKKYTQAGLATLSTLFSAMEAKFNPTGLAAVDASGVTIDMEYAIITGALPGTKGTSGNDLDVLATGTPAGEFDNLLLIQ